MERKEILQINSTLVPSLQCPGCSDYFIPPIYQCTNGHSVCSHCGSVNSICTECSVSLASKVRNITLERMLESIQVQCKHPHCNQLVSLALRKSHEEYCEYNPNINCVIQDCCWVGEDLIGHMKKVHETKEFLMPRLGGVRGWNSKTWKNADWGFSIWNFGDEVILNKSLSTGEIFYLYLFDLDSSRRLVQLSASNAQTEVSYVIKTISIRSLKEVANALPFHLSIKEAEKHFLEPAEGLEEGYKRLSIRVSILE